MFTCCLGCAHSKESESPTKEESPNATKKPPESGDNLTVVDALRLEAQPTEDNSGSHSPDKAIPSATSEEPPTSPLCTVGKLDKIMVPDISATETIETEEAAGAAVAGDVPISETTTVPLNTENKSKGDVPRRQINPDSPPWVTKDMRMISESHEESFKATDLDTVSDIDKETAPTINFDLTRMTRSVDSLVGVMSPNSRMDPPPMMMYNNSIKPDSMVYLHSMNSTTGVMSPGISVITPGASHGLMFKASQKSLTAMSVMSDSGLPGGGKLRGAERSSIVMFDDDD